MKTRYMKVNGETAKPLPDRLQSESTHSIELTDDQYTSYVNPTYFKVIDGEPQAKTPEERGAYLLLEKNQEHDKSLHPLCERYQINEGGCNPNFFALLMSIKTLAQVQGVEMGAKAKACLDWVDALWVDYYTRKGDHTKGSDFSNHGEIPHAFAEVRAEVEAAQE